MHTRRRGPAAAAATALITVTLAACGSPAAQPPTSTPANTPTAASPASPPAGGATSAPAAADAASSAPVTSSQAPAEPSEAKPAPGRYVSLSDYRADKAAFHEGAVVLFFNASWCPTCQEATRNIEADPKALGPGLTVVSVDYDENTDLRQEYGVTYQHTFVLIDPDGAKVKAWSGSSTPREIAEKAA